MLMIQCHKHISHNKLTTTDENKKMLLLVTYHGPKCVCLCVCKRELERFPSTCGGLIISFPACSLTLDVKVIGAFGHSLSISVNASVRVCLCVSECMCAL